ncbi:MAG: hypothetical protein CMQ54_03495 [Gammaproteobacteria bacterium]|nr:hypothetical protein [Gammaproteobacteria bacterium]|tara:strand:+ start:1578 stop:2114 length:537 start_codon:yes stop_codon:yes gene_type:complete
MFYFLKALILTISLPSSIHAAEMIFGEEQLDNGIKVIFEAAPRDKIFPQNKFLEENKTDIHIEMLINWSKDSPKGSPDGGFIPYLDVIATIKNLNGNLLKVKLTPHLNITDNFHYAQNIKLPGKTDDLYDVIIEIKPPSGRDLGIHLDWKKKFNFLIKERKFSYEKLSFKAISLESRR